MLLKNSFGDNIVTYCIFDSDYHTDAEKKERYEEAAKRGVQMHIWKRKEIENYALVPNAIQRFISVKAPSTKNVPKVDAVTAKLDELTERLKEDVTAALITDLHSTNKSSGVSVAYKTGREYVDTCWKTQEKRWAIVSGKAIISGLSAWSREEYGVSFNSGNIMSQLRNDEIDAELKAVMTAIEHGEPFDAFSELTIK